MPENSFTGIFFFLKCKIESLVWDKVRDRVKVRVRDRIIIIFLFIDPSNGKIDKKKYRNGAKKYLKQSRVPYIASKSSE